MRVTVNRADQSPFNVKQWHCELSCGHEKWITSTRAPKLAICDHIEHAQARLTPYQAGVLKILRREFKGKWFTETDTYGLGFKRHRFSLDTLYKLGAILREPNAKHGYGDGQDPLNPWVYQVKHQEA